jgi:hypothetical protein
VPAAALYVRVHVWPLKFSFSVNVDSAVPFIVTLRVIPSVDVSPDGRVFVTELTGASMPNLGSGAEEIVNTVPSGLVTVVVPLVANANEL